MKAGIVGAGILGRLVAFSLSQKGWEITLFDKNKKENCSMTAAGLLAPLSELDKSEWIIYQLGMEGIQNHWPNILNKLSPIYFQKLGSISISHPQEKTELIHFVDRIKHRSKSMQINIETLNKERIVELEPELNKFQDGYYFPDEAHIDNQTLLHTLEKYLEEKITWLKNTKVVYLQPRKIHTETREYHDLDMVFDCRGVDAKNSFSDLRGIRGELLWVHAPNVHIQRPVRFLHPRYNIYIIPRPNQHYIIGASEIESEDLSPISVRTTLELLTAAYYLHPGFSEARIIKTATNIRPTLKNHLPKIKFTDGLIAINGLYRHGFLISPALIHDVIAWIEGGKNNIHYPQLWETYYD